MSGTNQRLRLRKGYVTETSDEGSLLPHREPVLAGMAAGCRRPALVAACRCGLRERVPWQGKIDTTVAQPTHVMYTLAWPGNRG